MSANSVKESANIIESLLAYYTTPISIAPVIQGETSNINGTIGTLAGVAQIATGTIQMIGKTIPNPVTFGLSIASFGSSMASIYQSYDESPDGKISQADFLSAMASLTTIVGVVATMTIAAPTLPVLATILVSTAVISSALTGWAIVSGISDETLEIKDAVDGMKQWLAIAGQALGDDYESQMQSTRSTMFSSLLDIVDIRSLNENQVEITALTGGTRLIVDTAHLGAYGVDKQGNVYFHSVSGTEIGVSDHTITISKDGSAAVSINGVPVFGLPQGSLITVGGSVLTAEVMLGEMKGTFSFSNESIDMRWQNASGSMVVDYATGKNGEGKLVGWTQDGKTYSSGDLATFISGAATDAADAKTLSQIQQTATQLSSLMKNVVEGVMLALDNAAALDLLAARIALAGVDDRWAPAFLGGHVSSSLLLAGYVSAEMQQVLSSLAQQRWQSSMPSLFWVTVIMEGDEGSYTATPYHWGFYTPGPSQFHYPLVLDLDGSGIKLVAPWQSNASFDLNADGNRESTGWVGAKNGILVLDRNDNGVVDGAAEWFGESFSPDGSSAPVGQDGFSALASIAVTGATVFSRDTALTDAATGKSYFDLVQIWVDSNQDGITDKGELKSFEELGIASLDLQSSISGSALAGAVISATAGYTKTDGTRGNMADVGLSGIDAPSVVREWMPSAASLVFAEYASKGYAALARAKSSAVISAVNENPIATASLISSLQTWMQTKRYGTSNGYSNPLFYLADSTLITTYLGNDFKQNQRKSTAGIDALSLLQSSSQLTDTVLATAMTTKNGADAIVAAQVAAQVANATGGTDARANADLTALLAATSWGEAAAAYLNANSTALQINGLVENLRIELNTLMPTGLSYQGHLPGGYTFYSPGDAKFAAVASTAFSNSLQLLGNLKIALDSLLGAFAQSSGYSKAYVGLSNGTITVGNEFNLILAGAGAQNFVLGSSVDHILLSSATGQISLQGFQTGAQGDQLQFLGLGNNVNVIEINGGIRLQTQDGQRYADIAGINIENFNLYANLVGVSSISFAEMSQSGTRSIRGERLYDGQVHINEITASNYGDTLIGDSLSSKLNGGNGNDKFIVLGAGYRIDGAGGSDTVSYGELGGGITANLKTGSDSLGSTLYRVENITGTAWRDNLIGDAYDNVIEGGRGYDTIEGGGGNDTYVFGRGDGADILINGVASNRTASSVLKLKDGISADDLWLSRQDDDLIVNIIGSEDRVQIKGWFTSIYRKLGAIELANGLRLNTNNIDLLIVNLNAWHQANPDFDPRHASSLPLGLTLLPYFTDDVVLPTVPEASNVALDVKRAYESQRAANGAALALATGVEISAMAASISSASASAQMIRTQIPIIGVPSGTRLYSYQSSYEPGLNRIIVTPRDFNSTNPLTGRGADVISWRQLSSLDAERFYFVRTVKSDRPGDVASTTLIEGDVGKMGSAISDLNAIAVAINSMSFSGQLIASATLARQEALGAAMAMNGSPDTNTTDSVRESALNFEGKLNSAIFEYQKLADYLSESQLALISNGARLAGILPVTSSSSYSEWVPPRPFPNTPGFWRTITTTTSYAFYSVADSNKFNALQSAQVIAQNAYNSAINKAAILLDTFKSIDDFSAVHFAEQGGTATAGSGGDLLIAGNGGNHVLNGGSGRDTFLFINENSEGIETVNEFQVNVHGDRLLLVPAGERIAYFNQDVGGYATVSYVLGNGGRTEIRLSGVNHGDLSLYDNVLGIETADFGAMSQGVSIDLDSQTPRDADGYTHVRNLSGSNFDDVLHGDDQDNLIFGGFGNDVLSGGAGNNILNGGAGIDTVTYAESSAAVVVNLDLGSATNGLGGTDTLISIENATGTHYADLLIGNSGTNILRGGDGDDVLDGGAGADTLIGGNGNDIYYVDHIDDLVVEEFDAGIDTVFANISYSIASQDNVENMTLAGSEDLNAIGNSSDNLLIGNVGSNVLEGGEGNDILVGGRGNDTLIGGAGNDTYRFSIGDGQDVIEENDNADGKLGVISFSQGIVPATVRVRRLGQDLVLHYGVDDTVTVRNWFVGISSQIEQITFFDGTQWTASHLSSMTNKSPTGEVTIEGIEKQGQALLASNTLVDADGLGALTYQWQSTLDGITWLDIEGAHGASYMLQQTEVGRQVRVAISYVDGGYTTETIFSTESAVILNINDAPTGSIVINGKAENEQLLTIVDTLNDADGMNTVSYQWQNSLDGIVWVNINGATDDSYMLSQAHIGQYVRVVASYTDGYGAAETVFSPMTSVVTKVNFNPSGLITIEGETYQYQTLVARNNLTDANGMGSLSYQWQRSIDGVAWNNIIGATQDSFGLEQIDVGNQVRVVISYTDQDGTHESVISTATSPITNVNDAPIGSVSIEGSAIQKQVLFANALLSDVDGMGALSYQWQSSADGVNWSNIIGANLSQITLRQAQVGLNVRVMVSYIDAYGFAESMASPASGIVENINDLPFGTVTVNGVAKLGGVLTVSHTLIDADGLGVIVYQWQRLSDGHIWSNIENMTAISYTLTAADVGYSIRALATYTDGYGTQESIAAAGSLIVTSANNRHEGTLGADILTGGAGDDEYVVNHVSDSVVEQANGGVDTVFASVTHTLAANVENLVLTGTAAINGTGNELDNILIGNDGNNVLTGGLGADTMYGGKGNDNYQVDNVNDVVVELANEGIDRIMTYVSYALPDNVENMTLYLGNFSVEGNALDNQFTAIALGSQQTISGGAGNDEYLINPGTSGFDKTIIEHENEGIDTVRSTGSYTLAANLEILYIVGANGIRGTGNELNNEIYGSDFANILDGRAGNDLLVGGKGNDTYLFSAGSGIDTIVENDATAGNLDIAKWDASHDTLWFSKAGNNLLVNVIGTNDTVIVKDWYLGNAYHVEQFKSGNGRTLSHTNVDALVQEMARFSPPPSGQTALHPAILNALSPVYAASWQ